MNSSSTSSRSAANTRSQPRRGQCPASLHTNPRTIALLVEQHLDSHENGHLFNRVSTMWYQLTNEMELEIARGTKSDLITGTTRFYASVSDYIQM